MNAAIELHDSEISEVTVVGHSLRIVLDPAYVHQSSGRPGVDPGDGVLQKAELVFTGASWTGLSPDCQGTISDGAVLVDEKSLVLVPCPMQSTGQITARIDFTSGRTLEVKAQEVSCAAVGPAKWLEKYAG